jgi:hypothetical protein
MICAALPTYSPKYIANAMYGVIPKFNVNVGWALEDCLIHFVRLICPAPNPSEWVINGHCIGVGEIFIDHV